MVETYKHIICLPGALSQATRRIWINTFACYNEFIGIINSKEDV